jgi:ribonuclease HII
MDLLRKYSDSVLMEAGIDEAGRGCLAGPVVAAAAVIDDNFSFPGLRDSKKMSDKLRRAAYDYIKNSGLCRYGVGIVSAFDIDRDGILPSTMRAMALAVEELQNVLKSTPDLLVIDGNYWKNEEVSIDFACVVKGDDKYMHVAAAACIAKVVRDDIMMHAALPGDPYSWKTNKGYGTAAHIKAIRNFGATVWHRKTFIPE